MDARWPVASFFHEEPACRQCIMTISLNAKPADKFGHQRASTLASQLAQDVRLMTMRLAAAWLTIWACSSPPSRRPQALAAWDMIAYAERTVPGLLRQFGFPEQKIPSVSKLSASQPFQHPAAFEAVLVTTPIFWNSWRDAVFRTAQSGRDTRYTLFSTPSRPCAGTQRTPLRLVLEEPGNCPPAHQRSGRFPAPVRVQSREEFSVTDAALHQSSRAGFRPLSTGGDLLTRCLCWLGQCANRVESDPR